VKPLRTIALAAVIAAIYPPGANAELSSCRNLPDYAALKAALTSAVADETSGLDFQMWATIVDRDGIVCAVAFSGGDRGAQWPGSRVISAQKANTANSFSLNGLALSTANLYSAVLFIGGVALFAFGSALPDTPIDLSVRWITVVRDAAVMRWVVAFGCFFFFVYGVHYKKVGSWVSSR